MTRSGVVIDAGKMQIIDQKTATIDQLVAPEILDIEKQKKQQKQPVVPLLQVPWGQEATKVSGTQVDAAMLDDGKSPLPKSTLTSNRKDTERSRVSRTIVGGNLELSNRASLEQTNGSISERVAESVAESQVNPRVDTGEDSKKMRIEDCSKRRTSAKEQNVKTKPAN